MEKTSIGGFFGLMPAVVRVFRKVAFIAKPAYTPANRKAFWQWPKSMEVQSGLMENGTLLVSEKSGIQSARQVILIDSLLANERSLATKSPCTKPQFEIFRIEHKEEQAIALYTHFSNSRFSEVPQAANHQIALLKSGDSVRYMANDRIDFNSTSRRQRTYALYDYLISYLGQTNAMEMSEAPSLVLNVPVNLSEYKVVDERKILK